jgi:focal adhesion kinase 1
MATAYLDPNLNHALAGGAKSRLSAGTGTAIERAPGAPDRVLKVFHHFESNSEHSTWASNIRHGDATDVRVRQWSHTHSVEVDVATNHRSRI